MQGYTRENNPGYFFNGKGSSGWIDPFKGRTTVPYIDIDWNSAAKVRIAHGILAAAAFVVFFPLGAICVAIFPGGTGLVLHVFCQAIGWAAFLVAFAMGIWMAANVQWEFYNLVSFLFQTFKNGEKERKKKKKKKKNYFPSVEIY